MSCHFQGRMRTRTKKRELHELPNTEIAKNPGLLHTLTSGVFEMLTEQKVGSHQLIERCEVLRSEERNFVQ